MEASATFMNIRRPSFDLANLLYKIIICAIFSYYFVANFKMSSSWDVVNLRSIDDVAVQQSIRRIQLAAISGDWKIVFSFVDYAYGCIFWIINGILQFPFYFIGNAQLQIIVGREISLIFVFSGIYLIGKIVDHINNALQFTGMKYEVLTVISTMPIIGVIGTKAHVNAQSFFFSILSLFIIVRVPKLTGKNLATSALVAGIAIGMKATSILILPISCLLIFGKLKEQKKFKIIKSQFGYVAITQIVALISTAPIIVFFPLYKDEIRRIVQTFSMFINLGEVSTVSVSDRLFGGIGYFLSPIALAISMFGFVVLLFVELKNGVKIIFSVFVGLISAAIVVLAAVHKDAIYVGNYIISVAFLIPIGILALNKLGIQDTYKKCIAASLVVLMTLSGLANRNLIMQRYSFFKISNSDEIQEKLTARDEIDKLVSPIELPARVLMDYEAVFPLTNFTKGAEIRYLYGDLSNYQTGIWGIFDFISLNIRGYYNYLPADDSKPLSPEQAIRDELLKKGTLKGIEYSKIYERGDEVVFKLKVKP